MDKNRDLMSIAAEQYGIRSPLPDDTVVAMAYVPYQNAGRLYAPEQALASGTLFPELNKPFEPGRKSGGYDDDRA